MIRLLALLVLLVLGYHLVLSIYDAFRRLRWRGEAENA